MPHSDTQPLCIYIKIHDSVINFAYSNHKNNWYIINNKFHNCHNLYTLNTFCSATNDQHVVVSGHWEHVARQNIQTLSTVYPCCLVSISNYLRRWTHASSILLSTSYRFVLVMNIAEMLLIWC